MAIGLLAAGLMGGGSLLGGILGGSSASKAAKEQAAAARYAADLQYQQYMQQRADQEPWRAAGQQALNKLIPLATEYTPFGMQQFQADPGYQFRLQEGLKQLQGQAAARGGLLSGATMRGVQKYGQEAASQEYQNAFNRYQTERQARLNPLQSLAGVGQTAVNQLGQAGQAYAAGAGEAAMQGANARASGYIGSANAYANALGQIGNLYMMNKMGAFDTPAIPSAYQYAGPYGLGSAQAGLATTTTTPGMTTISY